ncbi:hypothetical protein [Streptomyces sp. NPDC059928]|uniref:hypothetical protein n=1 Tax=unclassified Streptomyces TaxID=2593676 RepID=UPI0036507E40
MTDQPTLRNRISGVIQEAYLTAPDDGAIGDFMADAVMAVLSGADEIRLLRERVAELEAWAHGCDGEGCVLPHSSWCQGAKAFAASHGGCTCGRPWEGTPQPHAGHCWLKSPPRDEVEQMRRALAARAAPVDRAAVLREAADECDRRATAIDALSSSDFGEEARAARELAAAATEFRRMADEAQQAECPQCGTTGACNGGPCPLNGPSTRVADEAQQPEGTATLVIGRNSSHCSACSEETLIGRTHHTDVSGWTPRPGGGCGARFTAMRSDYRGVTEDDLKALRPDLPVEAEGPQR